MLALPGVEEDSLEALAGANLLQIPQLKRALAQNPAATKGLLSKALGAGPASEAIKVCDHLPTIDVSWRRPELVPAPASNEVRIGVVGDACHPCNLLVQGRGQLLGVVR